MAWRRAARDTLCSLDWLVSSGVTLLSLLKVAQTDGDWSEKDWNDYFWYWCERGWALDADHAAFLKTLGA